MKRFILLSFSSTDKDDCGLPYLCSDSGCDETRLTDQQSSHTSVLKPFFASEAPSKMAQSTEESNVFFEKQKRNQRKGKKNKTMT